jgi:PBP1b-binding outer membrane lipoprotein LpoB
MRMLAYAAGESIENLPLAQSISGKPVLMTMPIQAVTLHAADTKYLLTTLTSLLALNGKIQCLEAEQRDAALVRLGQRPAAALPDVRIEAGRQLNAHYILAGFLFELPQASASSASARRTAGVEAPTLYKLVLELTDVKTGLVAHQMAHYRSHHAGKAVFGR